MKSGRTRFSNMDEVRAYQAEAAKKSDFERTEVAKEKTGVRLDGVTADQPGQRQGDPDLYLRLCARFLWHRRDHGCAGTRYPRLGFCQKIWPADHRGGQGRRRGKGSLHGLRHRHHGQFRHSGRPDRRRGQEKDHRSVWRKRALAMQRSTSSCATGSSPASAIGASPSRWYIARSAARCRCRRASCRCACRM